MMQEQEITEEYVDCLGCGGEIIPNYDRVDHTISWIFEVEDVIRPKDAFRFCCAACRKEFRAKNKVLDTPGKGRQVKSQSYTRSRNHFDSPLMQLERMFDTDICVVCIALGGVNVKPRNKALCGYHMSQPPVGFKCPIYKKTDGKVRCGYKSKIEGKQCPIHKLNLEPYWNPLPENLEFLKGKKKLSKWLYAQITTGRGRDRGLEVLDKIGQALEIGNGSAILNLVSVAEVVSKGEIQ